MNPLGLYVHWPFCSRICPYCDFTVAKSRAVDEALWIDALTEDLTFLADLTETRPLVSVYFGGGTPSLIPPKVAEAVLAKAEALFGVQDGAERTIEANPDDRGRFETLRSLGFDRLSLGVQSFSDEELRFLGRNHGAVDSRQAIEEALRHFCLVSLDFIYALPDQSLDAWRNRLLDITSQGADHLSLYQLTIEPETAFGRAAHRGSLVPMPDERAADFYDLTQDVTSAAGYPAYEVSNHARAGARAVHNTLYWQDAEWLAIGPGAHGRIGSAGKRLATTGASAAVRYPALPLSQRLAIQELSEVEQALETLASGVRPVEGLELSRLGASATAVAKRAEPLVNEGLITVSEGRLAATHHGRLLLDQLTAFLADAIDDDADT